MWDFLWFALTGAMALYWVLWMVGCRVPGTSNEPFRGWRFPCEDRKEAAKRQDRPDGWPPSGTPYLY